MKTKKILTSNLKPGMVSSEAAYTYTNHLVIQSNTTLTPEIIDKLKYYAVKSVRVYIPDEDAPKEKEKILQQIHHKKKLLSLMDQVLMVLLILNEYNRQNSS